MFKIVASGFIHPLKSVHLHFIPKVQDVFPTGICSFMPFHDAIRSCTLTIVFYFKPLAVSLSTVLPGLMITVIGQFLNGKILSFLMDVTLGCKIIPKHFVCGELVPRLTIQCTFSQSLRTPFLRCFGGALSLMA